MVVLDRIVTRGGDEGQTSLGDGSRIAKTQPRIVAIGAIDELNSALGVARVYAGEPYQSLIGHIQQDLFDMGADLCMPEGNQNNGSVDQQSPLRMQVSQVEWLENQVVQLNDGLEPLKSFVLPGGSLAAAHLHHARSICRRAELQLLGLHESERLNPALMHYINRLSDVLFVMSRAINAANGGDILWEPGKNRSE